MGLKPGAFGGMPICVPRPDIITTKTFPYTMPNGLLAGLSCEGEGKPVHCGSMS